MKRSTVAHYRCPLDGSVLTLVDAPPGDTVESGSLVSGSGRRYTIADGIPNLVYPDRLSSLEQQTVSDYDRVAEQIYDTAVDWQFSAFMEDENAVRDGMVELL